MSRLTDRTAGTRRCAKGQTCSTSGCICQCSLIKHIYAQLIDDVKGCDLTATSSLEKPIREGAKTSTIAAAKAVGKLIAGARQGKKGSGRRLIAAAITSRDQSLLRMRA
jgi:ribosomal protein L18